MKNKVQEEEPLATTYGKIASVDTSIDDKIDSALTDTKKT